MSNELNKAVESAAIKERTQLNATGGWLGRFWGDQSGNMSFLAVTGALVMMVFGGVGIDMIHAELKRTKVQNTLDRAVLAAANMENPVAPETTVQEYFDAMSMGDALQSVIVDQSVNARLVTADGRITMPSNFMSLIGVDTLQAQGSATARNALTKIEVSLVLDVSGSMGGQKIVQLREAAKSFVDSMIPDGGSNGMVTISLVPYNATVNMGPTLSEYYTMEGLHDFSACASFEDDTFTATGIDPDVALDQIAHFDPYGGGAEADRFWCPTGETSAIIPISSNPDQLKAHIDTLTAGGNTAIDLGVKWGTALLDPAAQPVVSDMINDGQMLPPVGTRPAAYTDTETLKFIVVMTDGQNTSQYDLKDANKYGDSNIWIDDHGTPGSGDDRYSVLLSDQPGTANDVYLWTHETGSPSSAFQSTPYSWGSGPTNGPGVDINGDGLPEEGGGARRMTNAELYARLGTANIANDFYWFGYQHGQSSYNDYYDAYYVYETIVNGSQADSRLSTVCDAARNQGIVVYAIGVEAPQAGLDAMSDCASSPAHYYDVDGSELNQTFSAIARSLRTLRLTQ